MNNSFAYYDSPLTIMLLNGPGSAKLVKMAFCYLWKDDVKGIHQPVEVVVNEIGSEGQKLSAQEDVSKVYLQQAIKKVENFAENHFACPVSVHLNVLQKRRFDSPKL